MRYFIFDMDGTLYRFNNGQAGSFRSSSIFRAVKSNTCKLLADRFHVKDPEAADIVFRFPVKKTLVPLDACNHVKLYLPDFEKIKTKRLRDPLVKMIKPYIKNLAVDVGVEAALMYDPLTVYSLINPSACTKKDYNVQVEINSKLTSGMTVADMQRTPNMTIIERISEKAFKNAFIGILSQRDP